MGCATSKADGKSKRAGTASAGRRVSIEPSGMAAVQLLDRAPSSAAAARRAAVAAAVQGKPLKAPSLQQPRSTPAIDNPLWPSGHDSRRSNCGGPPSACDSSWDWVAGGREGGSSFWTGPHCAWQAQQGDSTGSWALRPMRRSLSSDTVRASSMPTMGFMPRQRDPSLFGVTDKRRPMPVRETRRIRAATLAGVSLINQYMVMSYLGEGSCGRVYLCMDIHDSRLYAVKVLLKDELTWRHRRLASAGSDGLADLRREIAVMRTLRHRNIVSLREVVEDEGQILLVLEYMEGGPVLSRAALSAGARLPEELARSYFHDMCKAVDYLHHRKVMHGDIKPDNILMSASGAVAVSDFGCAMRGGGVQTRSSGTPAFLAPEMMVPNARYRGRPTDIYALGACLYTFVFGRIPFTADSIPELFRIVRGQPLEFPADSLASPTLRDLLARMLDKDPRTRIPLKAVMAHPWVTCGGAAAMRTVRDMMDEAAPAGPTVLPPGGGGGGGSSNGGNGSGGSRLPDLLQTMNVCDVLPQDFLPLLLPAEVRVRAFQPGEYLMFQDDPADCAMFILEGEAEVLLWVPRPHSDGDSGVGDGGGTKDGAFAPAAPLCGGRDASPIDAGARSQHSAPETAERLHSAGGGIAAPPIASIPPGLAHEVVKAREYTSSLLRGPRDFLVAVRGPGQTVGEMALLEAAEAGSSDGPAAGAGQAAGSGGGGLGGPVAAGAAGKGSKRGDKGGGKGGRSGGEGITPIGRRCASVRAVGAMSVAVIPAAHFQHVRQQVQEAAWVRRSENTVLEALMRLANLHEALRAALCNQAAGRGRHRRSMDVPRWQI